MGSPVRTKVFRSGNSAAVRLPKEFALPEGTEVDIERDGDGLRIREVRRPIDLTGIWGACPGLRTRTREERAFERSERESSGATNQVDD